MLRKVYVEAKIKLIGEVEEGVSIDHIIGDMEHEFRFIGEEAAILDSEVIDFQVVDSK